MKNGRFTSTRENILRWICHDQKNKNRILHERFSEIFVLILTLKEVLEKL